MNDAQNRDTADIIWVSLLTHDSDTQFLWGMVTGGLVPGAGTGTQRWRGWCPGLASSQTPSWAPSFYPLELLSHKGGWSVRLNDPLVCKIHLYVIFKGDLGTVYHIFFTPKPRFSGQILTIHRNSLLALYWIHHWGIRALDRFSLQRTWKCSHDTFKSWKRANVTLFQHRGLS